MLPFHLPEISEGEIDSVRSCLQSGWLTTGSFARRFETEFRSFVGCSHAVALNSCTAAAHLALHILDIKEFDEVIIPTMSFAAAAEVVCHLGMRPVLIDCHPVSLNIDIKKIDRAVTPRTKAIIPVHLGGLPCEMDELLEIARFHKLKVIEDAAHAFPAVYRGRIIGSIGDYTCFSFYATKTITTGEGGMLTTDHGECIDRLRRLSLHGIDHRPNDGYSWDYDIVEPGHKYNMPDLAAALGIIQLAKCQRMWEARRRIASMYQKAFQNIQELELPSEPPDVRHAWHLYSIRLRLDRLRLSRNQFIAELRARNIGTSVHFKPLHLHSYYRRTYGYTPQDFPVATAAFDRIVSLPIYSLMTDTDVLQVIEAVNDVVQQYRR